MVASARHVHRSPRGYILLTTLLLLALAASAMVGVSRASLTKTLDASRAEQDLQRRWAVLSAQRALLPAAGKALAAAERATKSPRASTRLELPFGKITLVCLFSDEQSKYNPNGLFDRKGAAETERTLRTLLQTIDSSVPVELRPLAKPARQIKENQLLPAFQSFAQLLPALTPAELLGESSRTASVAEHLTCWTDGRLNFSRASAPALRAACAPVLNAAEIDRLLVLRRETPDATLPKLLPRLQLARGKRAQVEQLLTDASTCHSLWIVVQTPHRRWYHLAVTAEEKDARLTFEW